MATLGEYIPNANTKGYWKLNGNSTDSSGNGNNGTDTNITYYQANGRFGQVAYSSGSGDAKIAISSSASLISPTNNITISFWCNVSSLVNQTTPLLMRILPDPNPPYNSFAFDFSASGNNSLSFFLVTSSGGVTISNSNPISSNTWYNFIGTYNGSIMKLYKNGLEIASGSQTGNLNYGSSRELRICDNKTNLGQYYTGSVDEVILENVAWSAEKVKKYYTNAKGRFATL